MAKMANQELPDDQIEVEVEAEFEEAQDFARQLSLEDAQSGDWFSKLLRAVIKSYERNARAEYFQQKYPGLSSDDIADKLISVTVRYAAIAGAVAGLATSVNQVMALASAGATTAMLVSSVGAEMVYLTRIQIRLILDLSVIYNLQLDPEDPEDVLTVFGYVLGIKPTDLVGKGAQVAAGSATKSAIRTYLSKGTLKSVQDFGRRLGIKILQRTIIKYTVPVVSAAVGSTYNYSSTLYVGKIAKAHFSTRDKASDELSLLISRQHTYDLVFPAAVKYIAEVDGPLTKVEKEVYESIVTRMSFDSHTKKEFARLVQTEQNLFDAMASIQDSEQSQTLLDLMILMAIFDGELNSDEEAFLVRAASVLQQDLDVSAVRKRAAAYQVSLKEGVWSRISGLTLSSVQSLGNRTQEIGRDTSRSIRRTTEKGSELLRQFRKQARKDTE